MHSAMSDVHAHLPLASSGQGSAGVGGEAGQRAVALRCLAGACESGQLLVDIFVNYDCDLEGANLFERLVLALVRTAQAAPSASDAPAAAADEAHLRLLVSPSVLLNATGKQPSDIRHLLAATWLCEYTRSHGLHC